MRPPRSMVMTTAAATLLTIAVAAPGSASAATTTTTHRPTTATTHATVKAKPHPAPVATREVPPGKVFKLDRSVKAVHKSAAARSSTRSSARASVAAAAGETPAVGTVRRWLAINDVAGTVYRKNYTLRAVGAHIEVWVASDTDATSTGTAFPAGDCRNGVPGSTDITDAQAQDLARQFDTNMFPKESAAFSVAPNRDGSKARITGDYSGAGDRIVTLVDNVRDDNFFTFPAAPTYIAGFFSSQINELLDRNVMTIDAFDWLHRTGANPANNPTYDLCTSRPARPFLYEGTFAHEYQHLLEYYQDPSEVNFVNEGLSDFAISLVGYADTTANVDQPRAESHIFCFNGYGTVKTPYNTNPRDCGGPQNSLTLWGDEIGGNTILADYGNAWSFMLFLRDRYGLAFMSALHRDGNAQGLHGVQDQLDVFAPGTKVYDVVHDFQLMNLLDKTLEGSTHGNVSGYSRGAVTTKSLNASVNLDNPAAYARPGAAPNGADYVRLRNAAGTAVSGAQLESLSFNGAATLPTLPLAWTVATDPPGHAGNPAIWSGNASNTDATAVASVTVPADNPTLTYSEMHMVEPEYDYAYTEVSTDGGVTYTPLANASTVAGPYGPALNGESTGFETQTFDLSAYAGKTILLAFRYVSDGGVNLGGWWVDDITVGGTLISDGSSLAPFRSPTQVSPSKVFNWDLRLVGIKGDKAIVRSYNGASSVNLTAKELDRFRKYNTVVAVVAYDDPTEQVQQYAPYALTVNGVLQPGGS